jgi:hypothetical protein
MSAHAANENARHAGSVLCVATVGHNEDRLRGLIKASSWMMQVLATVGEVGPPDAWVGAGVVRDLVWGQLYGSGFEPGRVHDVDVVFFDPDDLRRSVDEQATRRLAAVMPEVPWQARNQAAVHIWYADKFGGDPVAPLRTIVDAVATWPETATAVAVRLDSGGEVEICAPFGVTDLMAGVWRRNPRRVSLQVSLARLARHAPPERWPAVTVIPPH